MHDLIKKEHHLFEQDRINSFTTWKFDEKQSCNKIAMAAAGFYKISNDESDACACFYCGKTLDEWAPNDDPFQEHKSHSPSCKFINLGRREGQLKVSEFLDLIQHWVIKQIDKAMEREGEERATIVENALNQLRNFSKKQ